MINVLWLPSWFPSTEFPQNGDFIDRHALAASKFANISLLYVQSSTLVREIHVKDSKVNANLFERSVFFPSIKFLNFFYYFFLYQKHFKALCRLKTPPDIVHVHVCYKAGLLALWFKFRYRIPYLITEHWTFFTNERSDNYKNCSKVLKWLIKLIYKNANGVLPVSCHLSSQLKLFFPECKLTVVPNVVDTKLFKWPDLQNEKFTFIHVSSLSNLKNPLAIIRVFNRLRIKYQGRIKLEMVGGLNDELGQKIKQEFDILNGISFLGQLPHEEVAARMRRANAFILFSTAENLPCVIAESLCCGLPVVSTNVGGIGEMIDDSNGVLVGPQDELALFNAMEHLLLNYDKFDREQIALKASEKYNPIIVGEQILCTYKDTLNRLYN